MRFSTPILSAVRAMHLADDASAGHDPYNHGARRARDPVILQATPAQHHEADQLLACFESQLQLELELLADAARAIP